MCDLSFVMLKSNCLYSYGQFSHATMTNSKVLWAIKIITTLYHKFYMKCAKSVKLQVSFIDKK